MTSEPFRSEQFWTSHHNFSNAPDLPDTGDMQFHGTTFRDGEQQPGVVFTEDEKVELGTLYSEAGIIAAWWNRLREKDMPLAMFPYHWDLVGQDPARIVIGEMSGLATIQYWCEWLGLETPAESEQEEILARIKEVSIGEARPRRVRRNLPRHDGAEVGRGAVRSAPASTDRARWGPGVVVSRRCDRNGPLPRPRAGTGTDSPTTSAGTGPTPGPDRGSPICQRLGR